MTSTSTIKESFRKQVDIDPDYKDLAFWYIEEEKQTVISLQQALEKKDYPKLACIGDMLYGHGASYGFLFISDIGKSIEKAAISKDDAYISSLIIELNNYLDFISDEL